MKIKICHFADHLTGREDGTYNHILKIVKYTDTQKYEHYLCFVGDEKIEAEFKSLGGKIVTIPQLKSKLPIKALIMFIRIYYLEKFQIVHCHYLKPYIIAGVINIFFRRNVIYNFHGLFIKNEYYNFLETKLYQITHFIICKLGGVQLALTPSKTSTYYLLIETRYFPKVLYYYNGESKINKDVIADHQIFLLLKKYNTSKIAIVGRIDKAKRIDIALNIIKNLISDNIPVNCFLFGDGDLLKDMKLLSKKLEINNFIHFLGYISNPQLYFKEFDILLITSEREGLPMVIWEAMSEGIPIVSTNVGGIKEIIVENNCGIVFDKNNIKEGTEILCSLLNDKGKREMLGRNGKSVIQNKYTIKIFKEKIEQIYDGLLLNESN